MPKKTMSVQAMAALGAIYRANRALTSQQIRENSRGVLAYGSKASSALHNLLRNELVECAQAGHPRNTLWDLSPKGRLEYELQAGITEQRAANGQ